ncbi:MAG: sulfite exporter TauE/SafE family protein [Gammaproteobacteria bacterium]|nr:sulfite exporter TauE/SafE family protein [Gammaproteobacteria bacterium]
MEFDFLQIIALLVLGYIAGIINTLAGGGSNLTLPALMVFGLPADIANATNRVGVFLQAIWGAKAFHGHGELPLHDIKGIFIPLSLGGILGALAASYAPVSYLKPVLLITMISLSLVILIKPSVVMPEPGTIPNRVRQTPSSWVMLFLSGLYGGFVQAGVGFVLIIALAGSLRYDLVKSNALKLLCTLGFTSIALAIFILRDQVAWVPGLILASTMMVGAHHGVKLAIKAKPESLKWFLFIMTVCGSAAAFYF